MPASPLLCWVLAGTAVAADCKLKQMDIPVRLVDGRPIANLTLNDTELPMLVDSGAFFSLLSASTAAQLKLPLRSLPEGMRIEGHTGRIDARRTRVDKVVLRGAELRGVDFIVGGNELGAGIMGVLGRNILAAADTEYDLAHGVVRLTFPQGDRAKTDFAYWAGTAPVVVVPLNDRDDNAIRVDVAINGKRVEALLDTGAPRTTMTLRTARRAGIDEADLAPAGRVGGAGAGRVKSWTAPVALFELGGEKIATNRLRVDDTDNTGIAMLLGLDYFLSHRIYVSRLQRQIYVTWNGGPVFAPADAARDRYDPRYAALPPEVAADDADALARRGAAAIASGDYQRAIEDLNRACALAPTVADHFVSRARAHLALRQPRPALADLDQALRLDATLADARLRRAGVRARLGDRPGAQADLLQLDAALPPASGLRADMAQLHATFDQAPEALRQFELWVGTHAKDARLPAILNARCWLRARLNIDLPLALQDCKEAVDREDDMAAYRDSLGWTYLRLGDAASAKKAFDSAITIEPLPFALYGRALALQRLNDPAAAERDLADARKREPRVDEQVRRQGFETAASAAPPKPPGP